VTFNCFLHTSQTDETRDPVSLRLEGTFGRTRTTRRAQFLGRRCSWTSGNKPTGIPQCPAFKLTLACSNSESSCSTYQSIVKARGHQKPLSDRQKFSLFVPFSFLRLTVYSAYQSGVLFCGQDIRVPLCQLAIVGGQLEHERKVVLASGRSLISDGHR
jgi:hypothetical protein